MSSKNVVKIFGQPKYMAIKDVENIIKATHKLLLPVAANKDIEEIWIGFTYKQSLLGKVQKEPFRGRLVKGWSSTLKSQSIGVIVIRANQHYSIIFIALIHELIHTYFPGYGEYFTSKLTEYLTKIIYYKQQPKDIEKKVKEFKIEQKEDYYSKSMNQIRVDLGMKLNKDDKTYHEKGIESIEDIHPSLKLFIDEKCIQGLRG